MFGAIASGAGGNHFAAFRDEVTQDGGVFVIDINDAVHTKPAVAAASRSSMRPNLGRNIGDSIAGLCSRRRVTGRKHRSPH